MTLFCRSKSRVTSVHSWYLTSLVTSHFFQVWRDFHRTKFELLRYIHFVWLTILYKRKIIWKAFVLWRSSLRRILFCIYRIAQFLYLCKTERCPKKFRFFGATIRNYIFSTWNVDFNFRVWYDKYVGQPVGCSSFSPGQPAENQKKWPLTVCSF